MLWFVSLGSGRNDQRLRIREAVWSELCFRKINLGTQREGLEQGDCWEERKQGCSCIWEEAVRAHTWVIEIPAQGGGGSPGHLLEADSLCFSAPYLQPLPFLKHLHTSQFSKREKNRVTLTRSPFYFYLFLCKKSDFISLGCSLLLINTKDNCLCMDVLFSFNFPLILNCFSSCDILSSVILWLHRLTVPFPFVIEYSGL